MGQYQIELTKAMELLASNNKVVFIGQSVEVAGTAMRTTLENINPQKLIEMPVDELVKLINSNLYSVIATIMRFKSEADADSKELMKIF